MRPTVFIVDAGRRIGMGHFSECWDLANLLAKRSPAPITFYMNGEMEMGNIEGFHFPYRKVEGDSVLSSVDTLAGWLSQLPRPLVIVDTRDPSNQTLSALKNHAGTLAAILDDSKHRHFTADLVISYSVTQNERFYKDTNGTRYLIGPAYMPLGRAAHEAWQREKLIEESCKFLFVNEGGSDPHNLTLKIIQDLETQRFPFKIVVICGPFMSPSHRQAIEAFKSSVKNAYEWVFAANRAEMSRYLSMADLAVTAAGNTLYELAIHGVPSITVCHHAAHNEVAKAFEKRGAVVNLGLGAEIAFGQIGSSVKELAFSKARRSELSRNMKTIVDGLGLRRIADAVLSQ